MGRGNVCRWRDGRSLICTFLSRRTSLGYISRPSIRNRRSLRGAAGGTGDGGVSQIVMDMGLFSFHHRTTGPHAEDRRRDEFAFPAKTHQRRRLHHLANPLSYSRSFWMFFEESFRRGYKGSRFHKSPRLAPFPKPSMVSSCYRLSSHGRQMYGRSSISKPSSNQMQFPHSPGCQAPYPLSAVYLSRRVIDCIGIQWFYVLYMIHRFSSRRPISSRVRRAFARSGYTAHSRIMVRKIRIPVRGGAHHPTGAPARPRCS